MAKINDELFESMLEEAFCEQYNYEASTEPSKEELDKLYPFTQRHMKDAKNLSKKNKKRKPIWMDYASKAAVIVLCVITAGFGLLMTDPGIRGTVGNAVTHWVDKYISIDFTGAEDTDKIDISKTVIGYIPEGYSLSEDNSDKDTISHIYANDIGEYIIIDIQSSSDIELMTENESHAVDIYNINGYEGYISYSETQKQGSVYFGTKHFTVAISGMTDREELIKIAEKIEIKE